MQIFFDTKDPYSPSDSRIIAFCKASSITTDGVHGTKTLNGEQAFMITIEFLSGGRDVMSFIMKNYNLKWIHANITKDGK